MMKETTSHTPAQIEAPRAMTVEHTGLSHGEPRAEQELVQKLAVAARCREPFTACRHDAMAAANTLYRMNQERCRLKAIHPRDLENKKQRNEPGAEPICSSNVLETEAATNRPLARVPRRFPIFEPAETRQ